MDQVFKALSDPARRHMLARLKTGPATIGDLAQPFDMSFAGASKHVGVLVSARLVRKEKVGRNQICTLDPAPLVELRDWLDTYSTYWASRLDALEAAVTRYDSEQ